MTLTEDKMKTATSKKTVMREDAVGDSRRQVIRLEQTIEALAEVLRFYGTSVSADLKLDGGKRAREALHVAGVKLR